MRFRQRSLLGLRLGAFMTALALALLLGVGRSSAVGGAGNYTNVGFTDGFESGSLSNWNGLLGNGTASVVGAAAHSGSNGLRITNTSGQFQVAVKALPNPLVDSSVSFWVREASGSGLQQVAQARDGASSAHMWDLMYDFGAHGFYFFPYGAGGSTQVFTGNNSAPADTWVQVELQYTATATGGARIFVNGQTQPSWSVSGDYTRTTNLQRIQLWNDGLNTTDFDDVTVATPAAAPTLPDAPTGLGGTGGNASAALSWTAPASNGGSP